MRFHLGLILGVSSLAFFSSSFAMAQGKTEKEIRTEADQAQTLFQSQNFAAARPLYEDLHVQRPSDLVFSERLAFCLLGDAGSQPPEQATATELRARTILKEAQAAGDNSNLLQILLDKLNSLDSNATPPPLPAGHEWLEKGEKAFSSGDLESAVTNYEKAYEVNPSYYAAALFAGDTLFKLDRPADAGIWFAKAIAIDPNIETAHRYWGDTLEKAGEHKRAEAEFIQAIIGEPYSRSPRVGLKQWADRNHARIAPPPIKLPGGSVTDGKDGHINITLPFSDSKKDDPETAASMSYSLAAATWHTEKFKKQFPSEKAYRHSLPEEVDSIHLMLTVLKENKIPDEKLSTSTKLLRELGDKGMLECWILLDNPDQGVAHDYVEYRKTHRDLLAKYIADYDVHQN